MTGQKIPGPTKEEEKNQDPDSLNCKQMTNEKFKPIRSWAGYRPPPPPPPKGEFCTLWFSETTLYKTQN